MELVTHEAGPYSDDTGERVYLAKFVAGAGPDESVIFIDGNPLDCRRENLAIAPNEYVDAVRSGATVEVTASRLPSGITRYTPLRSDRN